MIVGNSRSGKTTLADALATHLGVPHVELDAHFHQAGWTPTPTPEFRTAVKGADPDAYLLAEIMGDATEWLRGDTFDATMNYTFRQIALDFLAADRITGGEAVDALVRMHAMLAPETAAVCQNLIGSHDTARFLHESGERPDRLADSVSRDPLRGLDRKPRPQSAFYLHGGGHRAPRIGVLLLGVAIAFSARGSADLDHFTGLVLVDLEPAAQRTPDAQVCVGGRLASHRGSTSTCMASRWSLARIPGCSLTVTISAGTT